MLEALRTWWSRWDVEKRWPKPEASGDMNGISWRIYTMGSWQ